MVPMWPEYLEYATLILIFDLRKYVESVSVEIFWEVKSKSLGIDHYFHLDKIFQQQNLICTWHCVKGIHIRIYSGPHFSRIPHSDWIRRNTQYLSVFSPNAGKYEKNADQNNSEYEHFLRSVVLKMLKDQITTGKIGLVSVYAMLCAIEFFSLQLYWKYHSSIGVFHVFLNCANITFAKSISYRNWYI